MKYLQLALSGALLFTTPFMELETGNITISFDDVDHWKQYVVATLSGGYLYSMDGETFEENNQFILNENDTYTFYIMNEEGDITLETRTISNIDHDPPVLEADNEFIQSGHDPIYIQVNAYDTQSGIDLYKVITDAKVYESKSNSIQLSSNTERVRAIEVYDAAGNKGIFYMNQIRNPQNLKVVCLSNGYQDSIDYKANLKTTRETMYAISKKKVAVDDPSLEYKSDPYFSITENGTYYVYAKCMYYGDIYVSEPVEIQTEFVDTVAPLIDTIDVISNHPTNKDYSTSMYGMTVKVHAFDQYTDVNHQTIEGGAGILDYRLVDEKGNEVTSENGLFQVYENGTYECIVQDKLHHETHQLVTIKRIDNEPPEIRDSIFHAGFLAQDILMSNEDIKVDIQLEDASGIDLNSTYLLINDEKVAGTFIQGGLSFLIQKENELLNPILHTMDRVGNLIEKPINPYPILIDKEKPSVNEISEIISLDGKDWISNHQTIQYELSDYVSGIQSYSLFINEQLVNSKSFQTITHSHSTSFSTASYFDSISIRLEVIDFAQNKTTYTHTYYVDVDAPVVDYSLSQDSFYAPSQIVSITVDELNFDPNLIYIDIKKDGNSIQKPIQWNYVSNVWKTEIPFEEDGFYSFSISGKDRLNHSIEKPVYKEFVVDHTSPVINLFFDTPYQSFFQSYKTLTIQITEANFDENKVRITGLNLPAISSWVHIGNIHTAQVSFIEDNQYSLEVEMEDLAGNHASNKVDPFTIDTTAPSIDLISIEDHKIYADDLSFKINVTDTNFKKASVSISSYKGEVIWKRDVLDIQNGICFNYANIERIKENDGVYTMHIEAEDLAGNTSSKSISFSINRFGSSYTPSKAFQKILDKKVISSKNLANISIFEYNVNSIHDQSISINENGIIKNIDFKVKETKKDGFYQYEYIIDQSYFEKDGYYEIYVSSIDEAGNRNENRKLNDFIFALDNTAPSISITDINSHSVYNAKEREFNVIVLDELGLEEWSVQVNDECIYKGKDETSVKLSLSQKNHPQSIVVKAKDKAGNEMEYSLEDIVVSTNPIVRWFYNRVFFLLTLFFMICGCIGLKRRRK